MTEPASTPEPEDFVELQKLSDGLARPAIRKAFKQDPFTALERAGIDIAKIPPGIIDLLADLSDDELDVLGRVAESARKFDPPPGGESGHVGIIIH
jgi:hypothetical protein